LEIIAIYYLLDTLMLKAGNI